MPGGPVGRLQPGRPARGPRLGAGPRQRGMVTAEFAFASLAMVGAVVLIAWLLTVVMLLAQCQGLAGEVARQAARGDRSAVAKALADRPPGADVQVSAAGGQVHVRVALNARPWAPWLPGVPLRADATVLEEPK